MESAAAAPPRRKKRSSGDDAQEVDADQLNILIVEDDEYQTVALKIVLEATAKAVGLAVQISTVVTGAFALGECQSVQGRQIDMVLMDYILLNDEGEASRAASSHLPLIRAELGTAATIVMLSTSDQELELARCLDLGADAYQVKPVAPETVREIFKYAREKRDFLRKRRRRVDAIGEALAPSSSSLAPSSSSPPTQQQQQQPLRRVPTASDLPLGASASPASASPVFARRASNSERAAAAADDLAAKLSRCFSMLSANGSAFAHGRRSPVHLGMWTHTAASLGANAPDVARAHGGPQAMVAIKVCVCARQAARWLCHTQRACPLSRAHSVACSLTHARFHCTRVQHPSHCGLSLSLSLCTLCVYVCYR